MIFAPASQFHVYLQCLGACLGASSHFQQGKGPSRGRRRDCEPSFEALLSSWVTGFIYPEQTAGGWMGAGLRYGGDVL